MGCWLGSLNVPIAFSPINPRSKTSVTRMIALSKMSPFVPTVTSVDRFGINLILVCSERSFATIVHCNERHVQHLVDCIVRKNGIRNKICHVHWDRSCYNPSMAAQWMIQFAYLATLLDLQEANLEIINLMAVRNMRGSTCIYMHYRCMQRHRKALRTIHRVNLSIRSDLLHRNM